MYKLGLSSCDKKICDELFREYAENGISAMEVSEQDMKALILTAYAGLQRKTMLSFGRFIFRLPRLTK